MEQLIEEVEAYCAARGIAPQRLLRDAVKATWPLWKKWKDGESSPTMKVADRVRAYMAENPVHPPAHDHAAPVDQGGAA